MQGALKLHKFSYNQLRFSKRDKLLLSADPAGGVAGTAAPELVLFVVALRWFCLSTWQLPDDGVSFLRFTVTPASKIGRSPGLLRKKLDGVMYVGTPGSKNGEPRHSS